MLDMAYTRRIRVRTLVAALAVMIGVSACGGDDDDDVVIEGKRISVLALDEQLTADPELQQRQVRLPRPRQNNAWPQAGGDPHHAMQHLALAPSPRMIWRASVGQGSTDNNRMMAEPVVANGVVYALDSEWRVSAFDLNNGRRLWAANLEDDDESDSSAPGGGIGYDNGILYLAMGSGFAAAIDANSGSLIWRTDFDVALRGSPTIAQGNVYVTTHDNQLYALDARSGEIQWNHIAITEAAEMMGTASPAAAGNVVVAAFSSGELFALRAENGRVAWADSLTRTGRPTAMSSLNDINGHPVIDRGRVYAIGQSGRMAAIDLRSGERVWENNISSAHTPWVAGQYIFAVTQNSEVVCLDRASGKVRWISELQRYKDNDRQDDLVLWSGPVLAGDRLVLVSNHGYAVSLSPYNGQFLGAIDMPRRNYIPPIVADNTLLILSDNGTLYAFR